MNPVVLLVVLFVGQLNAPICVGKNCPPQILPGEVIMGAPIYIDTTPIAAPKPAPKRVYRWIEITEGGIDFEVWGYLDATGAAVWEPALPGNASRRQDARDAAARLARQKAQKADDLHQAAQAVDDAPLNFGLTPERIGQHADYSAATETGKRFVEEAKSQAQADDGGKIHVTVIGTVDDCAQVVNDIKTNPAFASIRDRLLVQDYRPDEWAVDPKLGYQTNGKPAILIQQGRSTRDPNGGRVLYRANDYASGPQGLAEAIRKADPNYKPERDPGPATGRDGNSFFSDNLPVLIGGAIVLVLVMCLPSHKSEPQP